MESTSKKRKAHGRVSDVAKKLRLQSHETGENCGCTKLKCFSTISDNIKKKIINDFNLLQSYDEQNSYLAGLITLIPVQRRRPRKPENEVENFNQSSYKYRVRCANEADDAQDIQVCYKAFLSLHGITGRRVQTIQNYLKVSGRVPKDGRGKHKNRPLKLSEEAEAAAVEHISTFKGRSTTIV